MCVVIDNYQFADEDYFYLHYITTCTVLIETNEVFSIKCNIMLQHNIIIS